MLETVYQIRPSKKARWILGFFFLSSLFVVMSCDIAFYYKIGCLIFLVINMLTIVKQVMINQKLKLQAVSQVEWLIFCGDGPPLSVQLARDTIVTPFLIVLRFHYNKKALSYVVMRDSMESRIFKALLLRLKVTSFAVK